MKTQQTNQTLNLPRLLNKEFDRVGRVIARSGSSIDQCPTCDAKPIEIEPGVQGFVNGTFKFRGATYDCDCETQILLRKHYYLANIGDQFQRLDWNDYRGPEATKTVVANYLENWKSFKKNGMGIEFASKKLGTGKTFAATYIGKELIKRGERVYFIPFLDLIGILTRQSEDWEESERRLYDSNVVILDDVMPPTSTPQRDLFHGKFEELIRNRTNYNRVTVMTTNLEPDDLLAEYPRPYSLLSAKQIPINMSGEDARSSWMDTENIELVANGEVRPIT